MTNPVGHGVGTKSGILPAVVMTLRLQQRLVQKGYDTVIYIVKEAKFKKISKPNNIIYGIL